MSTLTSAHEFDTGTSLQKAIHKVATFTTQVYQHVEAFNGRKLAKYGRALKSQYMALESHIQREDENDVCSWHAKPKWHLAEHIFDLACMQPTHCMLACSLHACVPITCILTLRACIPITCILTLAYFDTCILCTWMLSLFHLHCGGSVSV